MAKCPNYNGQRRPHFAGLRVSLRYGHITYDTYDSFYMITLSRCTGGCTSETKVPQKTTQMFIAKYLWKYIYDFIRNIFVKCIDILG